jgi:phosphohistidine swiveling domain-containing protein
MTESISMKICFLGHELPESSVSRFGGKASKLHILKSAGFNVPGGFVLQREEQDLKSEVLSIGGFPVAVRSSCSMEDMANASFAGLYETILYVKDHEELKKAVVQCFLSRDSQRVKDYLDTKGIKYTPESLTMSVLVQKMIDPLIAGVLFTLNPINGYEEEFYLEYCEGVGERLVSGHVTPSSCTFNINQKKICSEFINNEKTKIGSEILAELILESKKIQAHFGTPQDIEWAIDKNHQLHILQSRPITTFSFRSDVPEMTNADFKDGGVSARVCTPFMFSAYRNALQNSMGSYFQTIKLIKNPDDITWIEGFYGRVYWNAGAVKEGLKQIPDFNEEAFDRDLGLQKDYGKSGPHITKTTLSSVVNAVPVLIGLNQEFSDCETMVDQFRDHFSFQDKKLKEKLAELRDMTDPGFNQWFLDVIHFQVLTERNYFRTIYNNSNFQTEFKSSLKKMKKYQEGDEIELMSQLTGVSHLDVQTDLEKLARVANASGFDSNNYLNERERFLHFHYHHGPAELDISVPRWGEKKEWIDDLVKGATPSAKKSSKTFDETVKRLESGIGYLFKSGFYKTLNRSRRFLLIREEMRSYSTRAYYLLRLGMLEFGQRFKINEDSLFMLDLNEVKAHLMNPQGSLPDLSNRLLHYQGYKNFQAPNDFGGLVVQQSHSSKDGVMKGIGCSPGEITGRARVIFDIHETLNLTKNDILVTLFTDPGWTPVLARVGGVVTEVGGLLSHAAVIGREYGIPAVLNLNGATKMIKDGSLIKVNGKTGIIEILEEGS